MCWDQKLARSLVLQDGQKLATLRDAANVVLKLRSMEDFTLSEFAVEVLCKAEQTGKRTDVEDATKLIALALRHDNLLRENL